MFQDIKVIGIIRGISAPFFKDLMAVSFHAGLQALEITMNTPGAEEIIAQNRSDVPPGKLLGMGTIRNIHEARKAAAAGAMFFVTPNCNEEVINYAKTKNIPIVSGAMTPTEVYAAWEAGADMIKVFPCGALGGPKYIRDLRGPFEAIPLVAVGGVTSDNAAAHFTAGANAVGVSSALFGKQALQEKNIHELEKNVKVFIERCHIAKDIL